MALMKLARALAASLMLAAAGATVAPLAGAAAPTAPSGPVVKIDNFTFGPAALTVTVGATVTWINQDDIPHTVVATDQSFRSRVMDTDDRFSFTFTRPGEFAYFCSLHPHMVGKIIVKPS